MSDEKKSPETRRCKYCGERLLEGEPDCLEVVGDD